MKRILKISAIAFLVMLFADIRNTATAQPAGDVSYQTFYDELSPYGRWIEYPEYGYVWCPDEGPDFRPYGTNGRWVWNDDYDWMWVSDYSWGWAPFHYGRWFYDPMYGWMWVPGYDWSPAWVAWRGGGDYYGWAPLMPGINISVGFSWNNYNCPVDYWCFSPRRYITSPRIYNYCVSPRQNVTIINNTTIINNNYNIRRNVYVNGPGRRDVERYTNERVRSVRVREANGPGRAGFRRNNEVAVYRPSIRRDNDNRTAAPQRFDRYRGSNNVAGRNDNGLNRNNTTGGRLQRNNNSALGDRVAERRTEDAINRRNALENRVERNNNTPVERRNNNLENNNNAQRQSQDFNRRRIANERSAREMIDRNDRPARPQRFERQDAPIRNDNRIRNERNNTSSPRIWRNENNNRNFSNDAPARQERREFNNRNNNQQQQRQSIPQMNRRQEQPRRLETPQRNNNDNNGGNRRRVNRDR